MKDFNIFYCSSLIVETFSVFVYFVFFNFFLFSFKELSCWIHSSCLKDFSVFTFNVPSPLPLVSIIPDGKLAIHLIEDLLYMVILFLLLFVFAFGFWQFVSGMSVWTSEFFIWGIFGMCSFMVLIKFWKLWWHHLLKYSCFSLLCLSSDTLIMHIRACLTVSYRSFWLVPFFFLITSLDNLNWHILTFVDSFLLPADVFLLTSN